MSKREKFEWTNTWYDDMDSNEGTRVLLVGDSIIRDSRDLWQNYADKNIHMDMYATSKAIDDEYFLIELLYMLNTANYEIVRFNNGLHGIHLSKEEYGKYYEDAVKQILNKFPKIKLVIGLSTPVVSENNCNEFGEKNNLVLDRNNAAVNIAKKYNLIVDDLYSTVAGNAEIRANDTHHYNKEGNEIIGKHIAQLIKNLL